MEKFQEAASLTKLAKEGSQKKFENEFDFYDPLAISESVSMDFTKVVDDFTDKIQETNNENKNNINVNQKIGFIPCEICGLQYNAMQFKFHISKCQKYFHQFVETIPDSNLYQCKICQSNYKRTGLLYKHLEQSHEQIINEILLDQISSDFLPEKELFQNNPVKIETNDDEIFNITTTNTDVTSSSNDLVTSELKPWTLKPCPICNVTYRPGRDHKEHLEKCSRYFHLVIPNALDSYDCKFCKKSYQKTGLLYRHLEKYHENFLSTIGMKIQYN